MAAAKLQIGLDCRIDNGIPIEVINSASLVEQIIQRPVGAAAKSFSVATNHG
jgi:hypothetical protein